MSRQPKRKPETKIPLPVNSFRLLIEFIILLFMYYCIVHFLTMLRKEQSVSFCREPRVEGICQGSTVQNMPTIYLFNLYYYLFFLERSEVYKFVNIRAWITQNKTWLFMVAVSAVKRSLWLWVSTAEAFKRKKLKLQNMSKYRATSKLSVSHFSPLTALQQ